MKIFLMILVLTNSLQLFAKKSERIVFSGTKKNKNSRHDSQNNQPNRTVSGTESTKKITISFTGDLIIHDDLYKKVLKDKKHDFVKIWEKTLPLFAKADFSYLNLEGPTALGINDKLVDKGDVGFTYDLDVYSGTNFLFNYHPSLIDSLIKTGVDIVSTANNHTFDRGSVGVDKTIDALIEKNLSYVGTRKSKEQKADQFTITEIKDFKIAWVACSEALNGFKDKNSQILLCYKQKDKLLEIVKTLKKDKTIDAILVMPHWGVEYSHDPNKLQKNLAHDLLDAGAIAVIGSHPHVLQPVEKYVTKDNRETFIAYSLGNFVAFQRDVDRKSSALIYLDFEKTDTNETVISKYSYEPTTRSSTSVFPARHLKTVIEHVEKYLGPIDPAEESQN